MYTYVSAKVLLNTINSTWQSVDISNMTMVHIYATYKRVFVTLSFTSLGTQIIVDLNDIKGANQYNTETMNQFLVSNGINALPSVSNVVFSDPKYMKYSDAYRASYRVDICKIGIPLDSNMDKTLLTDARLFRPSYTTDMQDVFDYCLTSVNGFLHSTQTDGDYLYINDAGKTLAKSKFNQIGMMSFKDVGKVTQIPFTDSMIVKSDPTTLLKDNMYIDLSAFDLTNKTVLLSIGGYLHMVDNDTFYQVGTNTFSFKLSDGLYLQRYYESQVYLNFDDFYLPPLPSAPDLAIVDDIKNDITFTKYLKLTQSFVILIDCPKIFTNKYYIENRNLPGMFISYKEPKYPLFVGNGRIGEYWKVEEDGYWSVTVTDSYLRNPVFALSASADLDVTTAGLVPENRYSYGRGFLLEIGADSFY